MFAHIIAADDLITDDGIETSVLEIHECRNVVGVLLDLLDLLLIEIRGVHVLLRRARALRADGFAREALLVRDGGIALLHEDDLVVVHVGIREEHVLLALLCDVETVPEHLHAAAFEFGFLAGPVDSLELHFTAKAFGCLFCEVNVEADDLVVLVLKAHRREIIIKSDNDFSHLCCVVCRGGFFGTSAARQDRR